jgi:magnesium transporter
MGFFEARRYKSGCTGFVYPTHHISGGNSGSQASTLIIQAMALGEVTIADWWRVMRREIAIGLNAGRNAWVLLAFSG